MKIQKYLTKPALLFSLIAVAVFGLGACTKEEPADKIEDAVDEVGDAVEDAAEEVSDN